MSSFSQARGIDVQQVSLVINYDLPTNRENYIHRWVSPYTAPVWAPLCTCESDVADLYSAELVVVAVLAEKELLSTLSLRRTRGFFETLRRFTIQPWRRCLWMWLTWFEPWDFIFLNAVIAIVHLHCAYIIRGGKKLLNAKPWIRILGMC